jgi:hypothetical protein
MIEYDSRIFGGISNCFLNETEQDNALNDIKEKKELPDKYFLELWYLINTHGAFFLDDQEKIFVEEIFENKTIFSSSEENENCVNII